MGFSSRSEVLTYILAVGPLRPLGHDTVAGTGLLTLALGLGSLLGRRMGKVSKSVVKMTAIKMEAVFTNLSVAELCMHRDLILTGHLNTPEKTPL